MAIGTWFQLGAIPMGAIYGSYSATLVLLSYCIATLASYVALDLAACLRAEQNRHLSYYWLAGGALTMGVGVWSMHFIGMLAFNMPMPMRYDLTLTVFSMLVAVLASGFALFLIKHKARQLTSLIFGGILMGLGIAAMHYTGMAAMLGDMKIRYLPGLFALSILIAIVASEAALWLAIKGSRGTFRRQFVIRSVSAVMMGAAICGMHYTGMAAAVFLPVKREIMAMTMIDPSRLAYYIAGITAIVIVLALIASTYRQVLTVVQNEKNFLNTLLRNLEDGILACDAKGKIILLNASFRKIFHLDYDPKFLHFWPHNFKTYLPESEIPLSPEEFPLKKALAEERIRDMELNIVTQTGEKRQVIVHGQSIVGDQEIKLGAVMTVHDVTEKKRMEHLLLHQATHDYLTGLPNRLLLIDRLEQAIYHARRMKKIVAVFFFDLDRFKLINDTLGHNCGDLVLLEAAQRLRSCLREVDTVARLGGDEFIIILNDLNDEHSASVVAKKMLESLSKPFQIEQNEVNLTTSIGISFYPKDGEDAHALIKNADTAMYLAKDKGKNNFQFYIPDINLKAQKRLELENFMFHAVAQEEFELHYQPIMNAKTLRVEAFEALVRWRHPKLGLLAPSDFIPMAEKNGLILSIGEWVLRKAITQNKQWQIAGFPPVKMSVNIAGRQFSDTDIVDTIKTMLAEVDLAPEYLEVEITESVVFEHLEVMIDVLQALKKMGIGIALDDFGTGFSSLHYLKRLPITKIKVDGSFIQDIAQTPEDNAIVLAVIAMAKRLSLNVLAEGVETETQLAFLQTHECQEVQGYYFSKPLPPAACETFFISGR